MTTKAPLVKLTPRQREGRAINAVADLLRRTLRVPNIYLEPPSSVIAADVLAVDSGGAGDLHAVQIRLEKDLAPEGLKARSSDPEELTRAYSEYHPKFQKKMQVIYRQLMAVPAHFKYLAVPASSFASVFNELGHLGLFPPDGIGRLGVITIEQRKDEPPVVQIAVPAERFRVDSAKLRAIEARILAKNRPDIEVRI